MPIETDKGPGGVDVAYGKRTTLPVRNYDVTKVYGDTFREDGDGPVNHIVKEDENGNVGIGTAAPIYDLQIGSYGVSTDSTVALATSSTGTGTIRFGDGELGPEANSGRIQYDHSTNSFNIWTNTSERLRLTSTGLLGIGTSSPTAVVDARTATGASITAGRTSNSGVSSEPGYFDIAGPNASGTAKIWSRIKSVVTDATNASEDADTVFMTIGGGSLSDKMRLTSDGNLGLGVTPSAWVASSKALQIGSIASVSYNATTGASAFHNNAYQDAASTYKYQFTGQASRYEHVNGAHAWYTATSGTAGNAITFTQAMTLDANGNLGVSVTPSTWAAGYKAIEFAPGGSVFGNTSGNGNFFATNLYYDGAWKYKASLPATYYRQSVGEHSWHIAPSGTAGNTATLTQAMTLDNNGNLLLTGGGGLGYGTGSGGTVTQLTGKSTPVTINKPTGQITMNNSSLASNAVAVFTVNNSTVSASDVVQVNLKSGYATGGTYQVWAESPSSGLFNMCVRNISAGSLSEALVLNFTIIKGATA